MSVNSVLTGLPSYYGLASGNNSQTAKSAALTRELPKKPFATTDVSQSTASEVDGAIRDASVRSGDAPDVDRVEIPWERNRRQAGASAETSPSPSERSSPGIALYERISQYGSNEPATSALLKSWNNIMQGEQDTDSAVAAFAKALSQKETPGLESGVLDLTA